MAWVYDCNVIIVPWSCASVLLTGINCMAGRLFNFKCFYITIMVLIGSICHDVSETAESSNAL